MRRALFPALLACAALAACDDGESPSPALDMAADAGADAGEVLVDFGPDPQDQDPCALRNPLTREVGGWTVRVNGSNGAFEVIPPHGGAPVLAGAPACPTRRIRRGVGAPFQRTLFGAFEVELEGDRSEMTWAPAAVAVWAAGQPLAQPMSADAELRFEAAEHGALRVRLASAGADGLELAWACAPDEGFFGLGTQVVGPDLRGHTFPLWTQEQGNGKDGSIGFPLGNTLEAAYAPMGVWHSSAGYAAVIDSDRYSELDLCEGGAERVALRTLDAQTGFVLVPGATPRERMAGITDWTGRPPAVPAWTFAPWNDAVGGPARLYEVAERLRAEGVPSSAIWSEDWIGGEEGDFGFRLSYAWAWDPEVYPELPSNIDDLHAQGFAFLAYFNTFVPEPTAMFQEGVDGDYLVKDAAGELITFQDPAFRNAALIDLTNPDAREWMMSYKRRAAGEYGIDGWMADFSEWLPAEALMADGQTGWQFHNRYPLAYQQLNREAMEAVHEGATDDWLFFSRSGWASTTGGMSGLAPVLWGGDQDTDWDRDDGFPTVIPIGVNAGLAGVAYFGTDIAGYSALRSPYTTKELFYRWSAQGALTPVMRTHHGSSECSNWAFDRDPETLQHYRRWASVHTLLFPYLTALASEAQATGLPIMRHPLLVDEALARAPDTYFMGDDLLVAPVVEEAATERAVTLPAAGWWPLFGDAPLDDAAPTVAAPVTELPVFVRPGRAIPLLPRVVDSFYGATADGVSTLDDVAGQRLLALYPDAEGGVSGAWADALLTVQGMTEAPNWAQATTAMGPVPACGDGPVPACVEGDRLVLRPSGVLEVSVGDARVRVDAPDGEWHLAYAGTAWGEWATATPLTELMPDIPPPCEE